MVEKTATKKFMEDAGSPSMARTCLSQSGYKSITAMKS
ncbi:hypothetical protein N7488_008942 [Penicillium malachiteum]|nr:hypothetical protein N7488_008942 [Penicillium malachiteum]